MAVVVALCFGVVLSFALLLVRVYQVIFSARTAKPVGRRISGRCSLAVFLGSGGHTSEALMLLSALDFDRYSPRIYYISEGDALSMRKARELELLKAAETRKDTQSNAHTETPYSFIVIPRARRVHQSLLTVPVTAATSLAMSIWHITIAPLLSRHSVADVLLLNGPGTCLVLCLAALFNRILGLKSPRLIYVESFARVRRLSLSGKLSRGLVDRFIVQWPELVRDGQRGDYRGWLV